MKIQIFAILMVAVFAARLHGGPPPPPPTPEQECQKHFGNTVETDVCLWCVHWTFEIEEEDGEHFTQEERRELVEECLWFVPDACVPEDREDFDGEELGECLLCTIDQFDEDEEPEWEEIEEAAEECAGDYLDWSKIRSFAKARSHLKAKSGSKAAPRPPF